MKKLILLAICALCFPSQSHACVAPTKKINLSNSSLENNPIVIRGSNIYFEKGTNGEILFKYDQSLKKWCILKNNQVKPDCNLQASNQAVNDKNEVYAEIVFTKNKLKVFSLEQNGKVRGKAFIEFKDISEKLFEKIYITSSSGSKILMSHQLGTRDSIQSKSGSLSKSKNENLDLSKKLSGTISCNSDINIKPSRKH